MVYAKQNYDAFRKDKNQFFRQLPAQVDMGSKLTLVDERASHVGYTFLLENKKALEDEFTQMFAVLERQKEDNKEAFWLYCYYCATLLEAFYKAYSQQGKVEEYQKFKLKIKNRLEQVKAKEAQTEQSFIESLKKSFDDGFSNLLKAPFHLSKIRDYVAYSNLCRVYWIFCRLTLTTGFSLARDLQIIEKLDAVLGTHTDVDKIIGVIQAPTAVLNYFSVGLFLMRFAIDAGLLIRHTWFPTEAEQKDKTTAYERFKFELYKRHCNFANDLVWATVNFITNFNQITNIPGPIAGAITAVCLGFDVCLLLYKNHLAEQEYLVKKDQYDKEMKRYSAPVRGMTDEQREQHREMLRAQLQELEINLLTKQRTLYFATAAAALLVVGFTSALLFSPPGIVLASFFVCILASAMYFSVDAYAKYQEKSLQVEYAGKNNEVQLKEYLAARNDFIFTMAKHTIVPTLLIATFAICWPAAVALTVVYVGYELFHAYNQHSGNKKPEPLTLDAPEQKESEFNCCFA